MNNDYKKNRLRYLLKTNGFEPEHFQILASPNPGKFILKIELDYRGAKE